MSDIPYHRIVSRFYNRPLFLQPAAADTISGFLLSQMRAGPTDRALAGGDAGQSMQAFKETLAADGKSLELHAPRASRFHGEYGVGDDGRPLPYRRTADGTAILTLVGEFVNRGGWVGAQSGLISYEGFKHQIGRAASDRMVTNILLDIESPGGEAVGCFEAAATVRAAAKQKNVVAVVNGMAASAAYAIASAARRIVTMPTGISGSIGVVMLHLDLSKALEDRGIKPTFIFSGAHKVDGNPYEALPEAVRADFQRECDSFYAQFVETVAAGRKGMTADAVRATEARIYKGQDAVAAGLADTVGTLEEVLAELSGGASRLQTQPKGPSMTTETNPAAEAAKPKTAAELSAAFPALAAELQTAGAVAERERILGIQSLAMVGHEQLIAGLVADGKTTKAEAALQILGAEKQTRAGALKSVAAVEDVTGKVTAAPNASASEQPAAVPQNSDGWKQEWERSPALQEEFASAERYVAFKSASQRGVVKLLSRQSA